MSLDDTTLQTLASLNPSDMVEFFSAISDDEVKEFLAVVVKGEDSPESFFAFYELVTGIVCPEHARRWIRFIYGSKSRDRGSLIWSFRGSWKTTTITIMFTAYRIGKDPHKANLILQVNDDSAQKSSAAIARIIETHPAWKMCFPNVVPDYKRGWSQSGYEVMRDDVSYEEWIAMNSTRKDPTLLGLGFSSGSVIGKHPNGVLAIDDIHDEKNSVSAAERENVIRTLKGTILPTIVEDVTKMPGQRLETWEIIVGTPWTEDDAYHYLKSTGEFDFDRSPVMDLVMEGMPGAVHFDHKALKGWYVLAWAERFPKEVIISWYNKSGQREFGRMYMLDLEMGVEGGLKFHSYPNERIDLRWAYSGGVDYASTVEIRNRQLSLKDRSKFAICWGAKLPTGGAVIVGGYSGFVTQMEAENKAEAGQNVYANYSVTGVEMNGKGEEFFSLLQRKPHMKLLPFWTGKSSKRDRIERQLSPWLESGHIRISDADTPFLNALRKALREFPHGSTDELDALYAYAKTIPDVLVVPNNEETLPTPERPEQKRSTNPFSAFGRS